MHWLPPLPTSLGKKQIVRYTYEGFLHWIACCTSAAFPECGCVTYKVFCYCFKLEVNSEAICSWQRAFISGVPALVFAIYNTS